MAWQRRDGRIQTFYTLAKSETSEFSKANHHYTVSGHRQCLSTAIQHATVTKFSPNQRTLKLEAPATHQILLEADGRHYQTFAQMVDGEFKLPAGDAPAENNDRINNFCFRDPRTTIPYLLFEANTGRDYHPEGGVRPEYLTVNSPHDAYVPTANELKANSCVGIAEFLDDSFMALEALPPLMTANLVGDEIERINMLFRHNRYYLFFTARGAMMSSSHPLQTQRNALFGFQANRLLGSYTPLNGNGIVLQQSLSAAELTDPGHNPQYVYSWLILPNGRVLCYSWHSSDAGGKPYTHFTAGPCAVVMIDGDRTRITGLEYCIQPA